MVLEVVVAALSSAVALKRLFNFKVGNADLVVQPLMACLSTEEGSLSQLGAMALVEVTNVGKVATTLASLDLVVGDVEMQGIHTFRKLRYQAITVPKLQAVTSQGEWFFNCSIHEVEGLGRPFLEPSQMRRGIVVFPNDAKMEIAGSPKIAARCAGVEKRPEVELQMLLKG